jgi:HSP20 family protein
MAGLIPFNRRRDIFNTGFGDFSNMLDDFFADMWPIKRSLFCDTFKIDVRDNKNEYVVEAELPGINKDEIDISLVEGRLSIAVNKEENTGQNNDNYVHRERRVCSMRRSIYLADADTQGIKAKLDNGVLSITVPKTGKPDSSVKINIE